MTIMHKLAALAICALSASAEAGLYQCDALGNPSRIDQCYSNELRLIFNDIHLFYTGMDYARTNITEQEKQYLLQNNGWPAYRAARCNGDVRCDYELYAIEYRRIQAKRAQWRNGGDKMAELRANIAAGRYPITTETRLLPQKTRFVLPKLEPREPTRAEILAKLNEEEERKRNEPFKCVELNGSVKIFTMYDDPHGQPMYTLKPTTRNHLAVAETTEDGWALLVAATWDIGHSSFKNGTRAGWAKVSDLTYVNEGCDKVTKILYGE